VNKIEEKIEAAKAAMAIPEAWQRLGLPGQPRHSCSSPFREDRNPSFAIFDNGRKWKDHGTGERGDVINFAAAALNVKQSEATEWILDQVGGFTTSGHWPQVRAPAQHKPRPPQPRKPLQLPKLDNGTESEVLAIQKARKLPMKAPLALEILTLDRGLLRFGTVYDGATPRRAWIITDAAERNAQARRLDGLPWEKINAKAKTLPGSRAAWPIGLADAIDREQVFLVEGGPDLLAAAWVAYDQRSRDLPEIGFACMTGAANAIPDEALPAFEGKTVRIFAHHDEAGIKAARRWRDQLKGAGVAVTVLCSEVKGRDLNDAISEREQITLN
jgi:hypothetical protein